MRLFKRQSSAEYYRKLQLLCNAQKLHHLGSRAYYYDMQAIVESSQITNYTYVQDYVYRPLEKHMQPRLPWQKFPATNFFEPLALRILFSKAKNLYWFWELVSYGLRYMRFDKSRVFRVEHAHRALRCLEESQDLARIREIMQQKGGYRFYDLVVRGVFLLDRDRRKVIINPIYVARAATQVPVLHVARL